jgi:hypothetical protein
MEATGFSENVAAYLQSHIASHTSGPQSSELSVLTQDSYRAERIGLFHKADLSLYFLLWHI